MKRKIYKGIGIFMLAVGLHLVFFAILFYVLCFWGLEESYKDFHVEKMDDCTVEEYLDYFTSNEFEFARINGVVIKPQIWETAGGEYGVYIHIYSRTGREQVVVKNVSLREDRNIFLNLKDEQKNIFEDSLESIYPAEIYHGNIDCGVFTETDVDLSSQKKLYMTVEVQVENETKTVTKEIPYEITVIQYMTVPMR